MPRGRNQRSTMTSHAFLMRSGDEALPPLIQALRDRSCFDHPTDGVTVLQTHISYVLLTGDFAYKIKKPVSLAFLDFSTLEDRKYYCEEELRINRRLAPELYLDVVSITGTPETPVMNGQGRAIEYAVKMVQFPDADRLDRVADRGELNHSQIRSLAQSLAAFHEKVAIAEPNTPFADSVRLRREVMENFDALSTQTLPENEKLLLDDLRNWSARSLVDLGGQFRARKRIGKIRECHGDMHLANMALLNNHITMFDALEFNENLRWIDVQSELAFVAMDLEYHGLSGLGWLLVSFYLELTGDYAGLRVFRHYKVYRAMVRAKVAALRASQCEAESADAREALAELSAHIRLARVCMDEEQPTPLIVTHGLSGSGKSRLAAQLLQTMGAVCVRSDVERQHLMSTGATGIEDRYTSAGIDRTYRALAGHARTIIECGYPAIVDASFLKRHHRMTFLELSRELDVPFVILSLHAPQPILEARIVKRQAEASDASEATVDVLRRQRETMDALDAEERKLAMTVSSDAAADVPMIARRLLGARPAPRHRRLQAIRDEH
jgi:uncharacterized protein